MKKITYLLLILSLPTYSIAQQTGTELVASSIIFHDPGNNWPKTKATFNFSDTRPGSEARLATLHLDNTASTLCVMREQDGSEVIRHVVNNKCTYEVNGNTSPTEAEIEKYSLNDERSHMLRNYYLYLWGLPMKLTDTGTNIDDKIYMKEFNGKRTKAVRVTYDESVGNDIWYFYFDNNSSEMIGYQFFHDEAKGDGEYILLSGSEQINQLKIPKTRAWYTNPDSTLLGTDRLVKIDALEHFH